MSITVNLTHQNKGLQKHLRDHTARSTQILFQEDPECKHHQFVQAFGHGCNIQHNWGGGIAYHFSKQEPVMFENALADKNPELGGFSKGDSCVLKGAVGYNLYTQSSGGSGSFSYKALHNSVYKMILDVDETAKSKLDHLLDTRVDIALPMIGSGIAGGNPDICLVYMLRAVRDASKFLGEVPYDMTVHIIVWDDVYANMKKFHSGRIESFLDLPLLVCPSNAKMKDENVSYDTVFGIDNGSNRRIMSL